MANPYLADLTNQDHYTHMVTAVLLWCGIPEDQHLQCLSFDRDSDSLAKEYDAAMRIVLDAALKGKLAMYTTNFQRVVSAGHIDEQYLFDAVRLRLAQTGEYEFNPSAAEQVKISEFIEWVNGNYEGSLPPTLNGGNHQPTYTQLKAEVTRLKVRLDEAIPINSDDKAHITSRADLHLIAALLQASLGELRQFNISSQASLIEAIQNHYGDYAGLSKRNMERKFALANKTIAEVTR